MYCVCSERVCVSVLLCQVYDIVTHLSNQLLFSIFNVIILHESQVSLKSCNASYIAQTVSRPSLLESWSQILITEM